MSSAELSSGAEKAVELSRRRQTLITGWVLLLLAVFVAVVFGLGSSGSATFRLAFAGDALAIPNLVIPSAPYAYVVAVILAFLGARHFARGAAHWTGVLLGIGLLLASIIAGALWDGVGTDAPFWFGGALALLAAAAVSAILDPRVRRAQRVAV